MKKNFLLGFIAFAAMAVTSCTNDEMNEFIPQEKAIEFNTYLGRDAQARGLVTDAGNGTAGLQTTGFGVYAYLHKNGATETYGTPNFLNNEKVSGAAWGYTTKYWPKESDMEIDFLAYGPHKENDNENPFFNAGVLTFNVAAQPEDHIDLVVAEAKLNQTSTTGTPQGTVAFNFKHMLSRLGFAIEVEGAESATVTSVTFTSSSMKTSCTVDMKKASNLITTAIDDAASTSYELTISGENKYMFIVPQTLASADVTIGYSVTYPGSITTNGTATGSLPANSVFAQGTAYQIKATVTGNAIVFTASVAPWDPETPVVVQ